MAGVIRSYRYRLDPTHSQRRRLEELAAARRFVWNWGLERRISYYRRTGRNIGRSQLGRELTRLKRRPGFEWLTEADSQSLQQALDDLSHAFRAFFRGEARFPRFKSRKRDADRFRIPQRVRLQQASVRVPKVGVVRARISRLPAGKLGAATFKTDAAGHWFVTFVVRQTIDAATTSAAAFPQRPIGIDLGIRKFASCSNGAVIDNPRSAARDARRLSREHRRLARKRPGSRNRARQRRRLNRLYARARQRRADFLHKTSTSLVSAHDLICLEDLNVRGLARAKLSRQIHDVAFGEFRRQLEYKAESARRSIVCVDRFFPSSRRCSTCGKVDPSFGSTDLIWRCGCGLVLDRDVNAARNILTEGLALHAAAGNADAQNACGVDVRPSTEGDRHRSTNPDWDSKSEVLYPGAGRPR